MGMLDQLARSVETDHFLKALIFAPLGYGKTRFAGTAQLDKRTSPILVLDYEAGTTVLKGIQPEVQRISMKRDTAMETWALFDQIYTELASGNHPYKTVVIDSLSELYQLALLTRTEMPGRTAARIDHLDQDDYGVVGLNIRKLVRKFRDLPMHVIMTCMAMEEVDVLRGAVKRPALSTSLRVDVPGMFHVVGYLSKVELKEGDKTREGRALLLSGQKNIDVKCRLPTTQPEVPYLLEPTVSSLLDLVVGPVVTNAPPSETVAEGK